MKSLMLADKLRKSKGYVNFNHSQKMVILALLYYSPMEYRKSKINRCVNSNYRNCKPMI